MGRIQVNTGKGNQTINTNNVWERIVALETNGVPNLSAELNGVKSQLSQSTTIKGTTQSIIFNSNGTVQKVQHKDSSSVVIREDIFTYAKNLITEVRTLSSGGSVTFKYHLDTLETEVI